MRSDNEAVPAAIQKGFLRTLVEDVEAADQRRELSDTPGHRRDAVRTMFAAIEGVAWICREYVRTTAKALDVLDPILEMALLEQTYFVSDRGKVKTQTRYIAFTAMFKLVSKICEEISSSFFVDFTAYGWNCVLESIEIRNKLMHPKSFEDLNVSVDDLTKANIAFRWMVQNCAQMMEAVRTEIDFFNRNARELLEGLQRGDPAVIAEYQQALRLLKAEADRA